MINSYFEDEKVSRHMRWIKFLYYATESKAFLKVLNKASDIPRFCVKNRLIFRGKKQYKMIDVYIDEDKVNGYLGFLVVKNTPYIQQILFNKRQKFETYYEMHFKEINNKSIHLCKSWLNLFLNFEEIYELDNKFCTFSYEPWNPKIESKYDIICKKIIELQKEYSTKNIVIFLDFDTEHKKINIENEIRKEIKVLRVYHLDSKATDLLQLVDLLLASTIRGNGGKLTDKNFQQMNKKLGDKKYLRKGELKSYLGTYALKKDIKGKTKK